MTSNIFVFFHSLCGFNNPLAFKNVRDEHIDNIEAYIRKNHTQIPELKSTEFKLQIFGPNAAAKLDTFHFQDGDRLLINEMVMHVKCKFEEMGYKAALQYYSSKQDEYESHIKVSTVNTVEKSEKNNNHATPSHYFLNKLLATADKNSERKSGGYRYDFETKMYSSYLRLIVGPLAYQTIHQNLQAAIPSLTSVNRYIRASNCNITEGILRCDELLIYLKERNLPLAVSLAEDGTKVRDCVQYSSIHNQLVGFTLPVSSVSGLPIPFSYPARNSTEIMEHFLNGNPVSTFINVIMAQPIADVPPFCLLIFGSDNRYTSNDVSNRWKFIVTKLKEREIKVIAISSDSDPKYNSSMRYLSKIGKRSEFEWFSSDTNNYGPFYVQDHIHIATKMRNFLLRFIYNKHVLPFGKYFITLDHLHFIREHFPKDQHELTKTTLNPVDRQNFESARKMFDAKVLNLLKKNVPNSEGTVQYLQIMRDVIAAYMDRTITPLQRIRKMWYSIFLVRIWRDFIVSKKQYSLKNNFLTTNCYSCLEINAHSLISCMLHLRDTNQPELFSPYLFNSQTCEATFRLLRSMTSAFSTITNCTVKESTSRISKIQFQNEIMHRTSTHFIYPRFKNNSHIKPKIIHELPSPQEILNEIIFCRKSAIATATKLGLISKGNAQRLNIECKINSYIPKLNCISKRMKSLTIFDKTTIKMPDPRNIQLKDYSGKFNNIEVEEKSPYAVLYSASGKRIVVRKTSLCWLMANDSRKLSSDRLLRVQNPKKKHVANNKYVNTVKYPCNTISNRTKFVPK